MQQVTPDTKLKQLTGHTSPETAFIVDDYPYGFKLRCKMRYWIETTKNGQRFCQQSTDPRRPTEVWNKPKKSTYAKFAVLVQVDDPQHERNGHVLPLTLGFYANAKEVQSFMNKWKIEGYSEGAVNNAKAKIDAIVQQQEDEANRLAEVRH